MKEQEESLRQEYRAQRKQKRKEYKKIIADLTEQHEKELSELTSSLQTVKAQLDSREEEHKQLQRKLEEKEDELDGLRRRTILSHDAFNEMHKAIKGENIKGNSSATLMLNLKEDNDKKLLTSLSMCKLPDLRKINLQNVKEGGEAVKKFVINSLPDSFSSFHFNHGSLSEPQLTAEQYIPCLKSAASKVNDDFTVVRMKLAIPYFVTLITAAKHCKEI